MTTHTTKKKILLGDEYDDRLREALLATLRDLGAQTVDQWAGVGGSQQLDSLEIRIGDNTVLVEAETYMGLTIYGDADLVDRVEAGVRERMSGSRV